MTERLKFEWAINHIRHEVSIESNEYIIKLTYSTNNIIIISAVMTNETNVLAIFNIIASSLSESMYTSHADIRAKLIALMDNNKKGGDDV
jgi:hypothetical protein